MRNLYKIVYSIVFLLAASCAKEAFWNQETVVEMGRITGQLLSDEDQSPLKGIKILFERQTKANGGQAFIDTVATNEEGKFEYEIPFPNKVHVTIRDTGRYALDETFVEVLEKKDYPINLVSHPRFGVAPVKVTVIDTETDLALEEVNVSLLVRETATEQYSLVETLKTDEQGKVSFEKVAFPVLYKVRVEESKDRYVLDSLAGKVDKKAGVDVRLQIEPLFGEHAPVTIRTISEGGEAMANVGLVIKHKQDGKETFTVIDDLKSDAQGVLQTTLPYPSDAEISVFDNGNYFPVVQLARIVKGENSIQLTVKPIPPTTDVTINVLQSGTTTFLETVPVNVYERELGTSNAFTLLGKYISVNGIIKVENVDYPKELKIENAQNLGAHVAEDKAVLVNVPDYNPLTVTFSRPLVDNYMLLGNTSASTSARLRFADLGLYNDPAIFGANINQELTFQVKVKLVVSGQYNPSIGGTVSHYNANDGGNNEGFGFMHGNHSASPNWRFKFGKKMLASNPNTVVEGGDWVTLTAVIRKNGTRRKIFLYTNGVADASADLPADRTAVVGATAADMIFGRGPNQFGAGSMINYIKDFRIYNAALSDAYIAANACNDFIAPNDPNNANLIGYWPMNEGRATTFKNFSTYPGASGKDLALDDITNKSYKTIDRKNCN